MAINNVTGAQSIIKAGVCTSSTRPPSPFVGQMIFETDTSRLKVWLGSAWSAGTLHDSNLNVEYLVVAGGGAGGGWAGAGGGAGGFRTNVFSSASGANSLSESILLLSNGTYVVTIGAGGSPQTNGNNSVFGTITSIGGGQGSGLGVGAGGINASSGGCGGGGSWILNGANGVAGAGTAAQGFAGGGPVTWINTANHPAGGGGGAGQVGELPANSSASVSGRGGNGIPSSIDGNVFYYSGGGGGGGHSSAIGGAGGLGGGGGGSAAAGGGLGGGSARNTGGNGNSGSAGGANTGGGGGAGPAGAGNNGGTGGSGIVIVRYLTSSAVGKTISGGTVTTSGLYTIRTFTASGSLVIA